MDAKMIERMAREAGLLPPETMVWFIGEDGRMRYVNPSDIQITHNNTGGQCPSEVHGAAFHNLPPEGTQEEKVQHFAALVRDHALEEAARVAELTFEGSTGYGEDGDSGFDFSGENSAAAIRALKGQP